MTGTLNLATAYALWAQTVQLLRAPVEGPPENSCQMSRVFFDLLAAARDSNGCLQKRTIAKCVRQYTSGILGHCEEFDPVLVHRAKTQEKDFVDKMGVVRCREERCRVSRTRWVMVKQGVG